MYTKQLIYPVTSSRVVDDNEMNDGILESQYCILYQCCVELLF